MWDPRDPSSEQPYRGLAAELRADALDGLGGDLVDAAAGARGASEADQVDVVVQGERLGFGRIVASEKEAPNMLVILV
jgi:hypothetical protein